MIFLLFLLDSPDWPLPFYISSPLGSVWSSPLEDTVFPSTPALCVVPPECFQGLHVWSGAVGSKSGKLQNIVDCDNQELEAGANFSPRLITTDTWATVLNSIYPLPMPVTPDFVQYMFDVCTIYSLPTSIPYAVACLLHHLHHIPLLKSWTGQGVFLVTIIVVVKSLCVSPPPPSNFWWSCNLFEVDVFIHMEFEFCSHLDGHVVFSGPELGAFLCFCR